MLLVFGGPENLIFQGISATNLKTGSFSGNSLNFYQITDSGFT